MQVKIEGASNISEILPFALIVRLAGSHAIGCQDQLSHFPSVSDRIPYCVSEPHEEINSINYRNVHINSDGEIIQYDYYCRTCNHKIYHFKNDIFYVKKISLRELNKHGYPFYNYSGNNKECKKWLPSLSNIEKVIS